MSPELEELIQRDRWQLALEGSGMSSIAFTTPARTVEVKGSERHHMAAVCRDLFLVALDGIDEQFGPSPLRLVLPPGTWVRECPPGSLNQSLRIWAAVSDDRVQVGGESVEVMELVLNSALAIGNDAVRLMARLHGQCEMHCWVDGPNRPWLAGIVRGGLSAGLLRPDVGWEDVGDLLWASAAEPVVTSFSVTDGFPNRYVAGTEDGVWPEDAEGELAWSDLSGEEQWAQAMDGLRRREPSLELRPDVWNEFRFGAGLDGIRLMEAAREQASPAAVPR